MTPSEALRRLSHREYLMLLSWQEDEWNEPSREDHYLMRIAKEIVESRPRKKGAAAPPTLDKYKIPFQFVKPTNPPVLVTEEEQPDQEEVLDEEQQRKVRVKTDLSKAKWLAFMTSPVEHRSK